MKISTNHLIKKQYDVEDAGARKEFGKGERREDYADAWKNTGNVILVGLDGSGKQQLARLLSERTGLDVAIPVNPGEAADLLAGGKRVIVLSDDLVEDQTVQPQIHGAGKVFYLMADSNTLSERIACRDGVEDREQLWRDMSGRLGVMEPVFYGVLHFILQGALPSEELVEDALEKIAY